MRTESRSNARGAGARRRSSRRPPVRGRPLASLKRLATGRLLILGVGNRLSGDDGAGSWLTERLSGSTAIECVDAGVAPENFLGVVRRRSPDAVLIADALDFGGAPGEARVFHPEQVVGGGLSTHAVSLKLVCEYLESVGIVTIRILGIQPESCGMGRDMSPAVRAAVASVAAELAGIVQTDRRS